MDMPRVSVDRAKKRAVDGWSMMILLFLVFPCNPAAVAGRYSNEEFSRTSTFADSYVFIQVSQKVTLAGEHFRCLKCAC
jgi:hypothetical protein